MLIGQKNIGISDILFTRWTDARQVAAAKAALTATAILNPQEKTDKNIIPIAQGIVDKVVSGVIVTVYRSEDALVSKAGVITYSSTAKTGNVTFELSKNRASATQVMTVIIPAGSAL